MKLVLALVLFSCLQAFAGNALDELINLDKPSIEELKQQATHIALPLEMPAETNARVTLEQMKDKLKVDGKLTPELELCINKAITDVAAITAARIAQERAAKDPIHVIVDR